MKKKAKKEKKLSKKPFFILAASTTTLVLSLIWLRVNLLTRTADDLRLSPPDKTLVIVMFSFFIVSYLIAMGTFIYILKRQEPHKLNRWYINRRLR